MRSRAIVLTAAFLAVGGVAIAAADGDPPASFTLDCTLTGRTVECVGELPAPGTTLPATTTSTAPPTTTTSSTTTTVPPTTSTSTSTTTTSTVSSTSTSPGTTVPPSTDAFTASFATPEDFTGRFWTYTGNYCSPGFTCNPCAQGVGVCSYPGDHDMACGVPTSKRTVHPDNRAENFWWCAPNGPDTGHVMAAMNTSGYSISGFTPRQAFTDISRICWDQNLTDLGGGKWFVVTLVPAAVLTSHPAPNQGTTSPYRLDYTIPEFDADNSPGDFNLQRESRWQFKLFRNQLRIFDSISGSSGADWGTDGGYVAGADVATRYRICMTETATGMQISQARPGTTATWTANGVRFPNGPVYVIWADDTYDADKHGGTGLYTWHVDNITIEEG